MLKLSALALSIIFFSTLSVASPTTQAKDLPKLGCYLENLPSQGQILKMEGDVFKAFQGLSAELKPGVTAECFYKRGRDQHYRFYCFAYDRRGSDSKLIFESVISEVAADFAKSTEFAFLLDDEPQRLRCHVAK